MGEIERSGARAELDKSAAKALSPAEQGRLAELEGDIESAIKTMAELYIVVGLALEEIHDNRLYRETHATFEDYLRERRVMARRTGYMYMEAAAAARRVQSSAQLSLSQAYELARLPIEEQEAYAAIISEKTVRQARAFVDGRRKAAQSDQLAAFEPSAVERMRAAVEKARQGTREIADACRQVFEALDELDGFAREAEEKGDAAEAQEIRDAITELLEEAKANWESSPEVMRMWAFVDRGETPLHEWLEEWRGALA